MVLVGNLPLSRDGTNEAPQVGRYSVSLRRSVGRRAERSACGRSNRKWRDENSRWPRIRRPAHHGGGKGAVAGHIPPDRVNAARQAVSLREIETVSFGLRAP